MARADKLLLLQPGCEGGGYRHTAGLVAEFWYSQGELRGHTGGLGLQQEERKAGSNFRAGREPRGVWEGAGFSGHSGRRLLLHTFCSSRFPSMPIAVWGEGWLVPSAATGGAAEVHRVLHPVPQRGCRRAPCPALLSVPARTCCGPWCEFSRRTGCRNVKV